MNHIHLNINRSLTYSFITLSRANIKPDACTFDYVYSTKAFHKKAFQTCNK